MAVQLWRSLPAVGELTVTWAIEAVGESDPPEQRFRHYGGTLYYSSGEEQKQILLHVLVDNLPKIDQEYRVRITNVLTEGKFCCFFLMALWSIGTGTIITADPIITIFFA